MASHPNDHRHQLVDAPKRHSDLDGHDDLELRVKHDCICPGVFHAGCSSE
jgi:hypothetical protein